MTKPIVFLSHSVHNKKELIAIKELLDKRAAGSIDFFLSCDGQSIPFGHNWVVSISDALAEAKLMFVFLSPHSLNSRWVHFEAGYAHAKKVKVVPICLPGLSFDKVSEPLRLLQGFNLHSAATMANLARICNEALGLKLPEEFSDAEFGQVRSTIANVDGFFGQHTRLIDSVVCHATAPFSDDLPVAVETFKRICQTQKPDWCLHKKPENDTGETFETNGATLRFYPSTESSNGKVTRRTLWISAAFGTHLFPFNSPAVEEFGKALGAVEWSVGLRFNNAVKIPNRMELTTKLLNTGIRLAGLQSFTFEENEFSTSVLEGTKIETKRSTIRDPWLVNLVNRLFDVGFLLEGDDEAPTDVDRLAAAVRKQSVAGWG